MARTFVAAYGTLWRRFALVMMMILVAGYMFNLALWAGKAFSGPSYERSRMSYAESFKSEILW